MPYAILRFQKRKAGGVAACERHNERKKEAYKSNPDIDMERSKNNYHLVKPPRYTYKKEINRMVAEAGCRTRKDSVMMVETLITASPEFMNSLPPEEQKAYFTMALDFISERVGEKNILSAVVHMDERTPHMHLCFVPITPDNKLSAKSILGKTEKGQGMKEIQYEIVKEIAVLSASDSGYTKEINLISWNGREPKYDIRSFSPNREKCGKGITLNADEAAALLKALQKEVNSGD